MTETWNSGGVAPTPPVADAPKPHRPFVFPIVGGIAVAVAVFAAIIASGVTDWGNSVCGPSAADLSAARRALRESYLEIWFVAACVPVGLMFIARSKQRRLWPWSALAGGFVVIALSLAATAQPSTWCVF